jgi:hypothetical protein
LVIALVPTPYLIPSPGLRPHLSRKEGGVIITPSPYGRRCPEGADEGDFDLEQKLNRILLKKT